MKLDIAMAGLIGALLGAGVYWIAGTASAQFPALVAHPVGVGVIFILLLGFAITEIPVMVFGLKKIAASATPRPFLLGTHFVFVMFASVYAAIFVLVTGQIAWGWVLAALMLIRFGAGALYK